MKKEDFFIDVIAENQETADLEGFLYSYLVHAKQDAKRKKKKKITKNKIKI